MALPKYKPSKSRTRSRKAANMRMELHSLRNCGHCGNKVQHHRVCPKCGYYNNKQIFEPEEMAK